MAAKHAWPMDPLGRKSLNSRAIVVAAATAILFSLVPSTQTALAHEEGEPDEVSTGPPDIQTDNAPIETEFEVNDPEVTWYSSRHGVSLQRSLEIANWMTEVGPLIEGLRERMPDNYAAVQVVHGGARGDDSMPAGELRIDLRVVSPDTTDVDALVAELDQANARIGGVSTNLIKVPKSRVELEIEAEELRTREKVVDVDIDFDFDSGTLVLKEPSKPPVLTDHDCPSLDQKKFDGGRAAFFDVDGGGCSYAGACTAGLGAFMAGRYGLTTSGHCFTDAGLPQGAVPNFLNHVVDLAYISTYPQKYVSGFPYYSDDGTDDDAGFFARRFGTTEVTARIWKYGANEWRLTTHHEWSPRALGLTVCVSASAASQNGEGTYCGEVVDEYIDIGNVLLQRWTKIDFADGQFPSGDGPGKGGSGAPAYWGNTAYGIQTGCDSVPACRYGFIYQVRYLHAALEAYNSDARMLCDDDGDGDNMGVKCVPS